MLLRGRPAARTTAGMCWREQRRAPQSCRRAAAGAGAGAESRLDAQPCVACCGPAGLLARPATCPRSPLPHFARPALTPLAQRLLEGTPTVSQRRRRALHSYYRRQNELIDALLETEAIHRGRFTNDADEARAQAWRRRLLPEPPPPPPPPPACGSWATGGRRAAAGLPAPLLLPPTLLPPAVAAAADTPLPFSRLPNGHLPDLLACSALACRRARRWRAR